MSEQKVWSSFLYRGGGILSERGVLGGAYLASILMIIFLPRLAPLTEISNMLPYLAGSLFVLGIVTAHVFFEVFVLLTGCTLDWVATWSFHKSTRDSLGADRRITLTELRSWKYREFRNAREVLLDDAAISTHCKEEIGKNTQIRTNISYLSGATLAGLISSIVTKQVWISTSPQLDKVTTSVLGSFMVLCLVAHIRRSWRMGRYVALSSIKANSLSEKLRTLLGPQT